MALILATCDRQYINSQGFFFFFLIIRERRRQKYPLPDIDQYIIAAQNNTYTNNQHGPAAHTLLMDSIRLAVAHAAAET
jgi:hypothetical protein